MNPALPVIAAAPANRHFERLGGREAVERLVTHFYRAMDMRPDAAAVRAMHAQDLTDTRAVLVTYLCEWTGGPRDYSATRGAPKLRRVHQPFAIDDSARDAWMACMRQALQETCTDPALRSELLAAFQKIADFLRNSQTGQHPASSAAPLFSPPHRSAP